MAWAIHHSCVCVGHVLPRFIEVRPFFSLSLSESSSTDMKVGRASDVAGIIGSTGSGCGSASGEGGVKGSGGFARLSREGRGGMEKEEETCWSVTGEAAREATALPLLTCLGKNIEETVPTPFSGSKEGKVKKLGFGDASRAFTSRWRSSRSLKIRTWQIQYQTIAGVCSVHSMYPFHYVLFVYSSIHLSLCLSLHPSVRPSVCLLQSPRVLAGPVQGSTG